jgi:ribosomal protein S27AE
MANSKMNCPKCGGEMNHHADKLTYASDGSKAPRFDRALGGVVEETHHCPSCGAIAARNAD